jgi:hypothetical protein
MKSKMVIFISGLTIGAICVFLILKNTSLIGKDFEYIQLKNDYRIDNSGYLKKGTVIRVDHGMDEGFTTYILYLNLSDGEDIESYKTEHKYTVIPYWLNSVDTP